MPFREEPSRDLRRGHIVKHSGPGRGIYRRAKIQLPSRSLSYHGLYYVKLKKGNMNTMV